MGSSSKKYKEKESRKRRHHSHSESEEREAPKEKRHRHRRHHKDKKREKPSKSYDYESDGTYLNYYDQWQAILKKYQYYIQTCNIIRAIYTLIMQCIAQSHWVIWVATHTYYMEHRIRMCCILTVHTQLYQTLGIWSVPKS